MSMKCRRGLKCAYADFQDNADISSDDFAIWAVVQAVESNDAEEKVVDTTIRGLGTFYNITHLMTSEMRSLKAYYRQMPSILCTKISWPYQ